MSKYALPRRVPSFYILEGRTPVACRDLIRLYEFVLSERRTIGRANPVPGVTVSTVFMPFAVAPPGQRPRLFETMVFGGTHDGYQERYATYDEAEAGHAATVELVCGGKLQ